MISGANTTFLAVCCLLAFAQSQSCKGNDQDTRCAKWKSRGRCDPEHENSAYVIKNCPQTCCGVGGPTPRPLAPTLRPPAPTPRPTPDATPDPVPSSNKPGKFDGAIIVPDQAGKRILILDPNKPWSQSSAILWEYKAEGYVKSLFNSKWSDAKVERINGKDYILFCGSGSKAVAMVSVETKKAVFNVGVGSSPHSIAMLPGGNILVVDTGGNSQNGVLFVFSLVTGKMLDRKPTGKYTHGATWMAKQKKVYAAPGGQIWGYDQNNGKLTLEKNGGWGSECNHDVMPGLTQDEIICTGGSKPKNNRGIHHYNAATRQKKPVHLVPGGVKGADIRRSDGQVIYVLGVDNSRDYRVRFVGRSDLGNSKFFFYKAHFYQTNIMLPDISVPGFSGAASSSRFDYSEEDEVTMNGSSQCVWASFWCFLFAPLLVFMH